MVRSRWEHLRVALTLCIASTGLPVATATSGTCNSQGRGAECSAPPASTRQDHELLSTLYYESHQARVMKTRPDHLTYIEGEYAFSIVADLDLQSRGPLSDAETAERSKHPVAS